MNFNIGFGGMNMGMGMGVNLPNMGFSVSHNMGTQPLRVGDKFHLKSLTTNKYLCAEQYGNVVCNRDQPAQWETFTIESAAKRFGEELRYGDRIGLRSAHGKLVCAEPSSVVCNRDSLGPWEQFTLVDPANTYSNNIIPQWGSLVALRSDHGKFVTFEYNGQVTAFRDQPGQTEQFHATAAGLPGDINQYQKAPQVNMNVSGMNVHTTPSYPSYPQQPMVVQQTTFVTSGPCKKCNGKGAFNPWGPCDLDDFHKKRLCPCCDGAKTSNRQNMCQSCKGMGATGTFGPCEVDDIHKKSLCSACNGKCYF